MIYIVIGTRAQLVKMAPVIKKIEERPWPLALLHTGQHKESISEICRDFRIVSPWHYLYRSTHEVKTIFHALKWLLSVLFVIAVKPYSLLPDYNNRDDHIILVHGDTFSTVIGALLGKRTGIPIAHIESGLRSFNWLNPFPEELNRLLTFRLIDMAFCPGKWAIGNLHRYKITKINTIHNTLLDALKIAVQSKTETHYPIPQRPYGVVSIHRFENIFFTRQFTLIIDQILSIADRYHLVFVLHPATHKRLQKTGLIDKLAHHQQIELRHRTGYFNFVKLLASSQFVITDGGSNQEELSYLNIPTFLMRKTTERQEGLGSSVSLGKLSDSALDDFLNRLSSGSNRNVDFLGFNDSPSDLICQHIAFAANKVNNT
ncbi:MAG: UDP-N-acetylglucosamine 2-epimerase (non-hydrolyzing) [Methylomicrobium sp.]